MLRKLIKHEFKATAKIMGLLYAAMILLSLLTRLSDNLPSDNAILEAVQRFLIATYVIALIGVGIVSTVILLYRFYTNMLKDQGYLTHTLPVKMWQQLVAKVFTYTVWIIATMAVLCVALAVYLVGKVVSFADFGEALQAIAECYGKFPQLIPFTLVVLVLMLTQVIANILSCSAAISLGQIFKKHRILGAVVFYVAINYATGILTSVVSMLMMPTIINMTDDLESKLTIAGETAVTASENVSAVLGMFYRICPYLFAVNLVLIAIYYIITHFMLTKKLNLE